MDPLSILVVAAAVFLVASAAQAVTGFGAALVAVPLLSMALGPTRAVVVAVALSGVVTALGWWRERDHVVTPAAIRLSVSGLVGMPFGLLALLVMSESSLTVLISGVVLVLALAMSIDRGLPGGPTAQVGAGVVSGALVTSTSMNGPPLVLALHGSDLSPRQIRATLQAVFCNQDAIALVAFLALGQVDATAALAILGGSLGVPLGWAVGDRLFRVLSPERFRHFVVGGLFATAIVSGLGVLL